MQHTKLEWEVDGCTVYALEHDGWNKGEETFRNRFSAWVQGYHVSKEELEANARLMAAAPELLEALQEISKCIEWYQNNQDSPKSALHHFMERVEIVESAIKKATRKP